MYISICKYRTGNRKTYGIGTNVHVPLQLSVCVHVRLGLTKQRKMLWCSHLVVEVVSHESILHPVVDEPSVMPPTRRARERTNVVFLILTIAQRFVYVYVCSNQSTDRQLLC